MQSIKQRDPKFFLQFLNLHAQGRLGYPTGIRSFAKMTVFVQGNQIVKLGQGHKNFNRCKRRYGRVLAPQPR